MLDSTDKNVNMSSPGTEDGKNETEGLLNPQERKALTKHVQPRDVEIEEDHTSQSTALKHSKHSRNSKNADSFVVHNKYGMGGNDSEEDDDAILEKAQDKTPQTKRRIIHDENVKKVKKLTPLQTSFTIFKGFVCTGILYMPKDFVNGGWLFSAICIVIAEVVTLYCIHLLL